MKTQNPKLEQSLNPSVSKNVAPSGKSKINVTNNYLQTIYKRVSLATILIPVLGSIAAIGLPWRTSIGLVEIILFMSMYALTLLGVEVGFHRYFSHRSFQTTPVIKIILAVLGSMAAQGGVIFWVAHHRRHHQYTDQLNDPHSPHLHGDGIWNRLHGFWHAHLGWTLGGEITNSMLFAKDWLQDPIIAKVNQLQQFWVLLGLIIPAAIDGLITKSWMGVLLGFLWGGLVRIFFAQQTISSTNSICHIYGGRSFNSGDRSTNNLWLAIPSWGQSWHNNHHAFPSSAIVGLKWWQIDPGGVLIRILEKVGLVWQVKVPTEGQIAAKKLTEPG
jgi:stearoyl-CoA desaturase (delta-9 desaturase)